MSLNFSITSSNEYPGLISFRMDWWISLQSKELSRVFSNTTVQRINFLAHWLLYSLGLNCRLEVLGQAGTA